MEIRIRQLYNWYKLGIKPWEWDYERYGREDNKDMIGFFYNDDLENIKQLDEFERKTTK